MIHVRYRNQMRAVIVTLFFGHAVCSNPPLSQSGCAACVGECIGGLCFETLARGPAVRPLVSQPVWDRFEAPMPSLTANGAGGISGIAVEYKNALPRAELTDFGHRSVQLLPLAPAQGAPHAPVYLLQDSVDPIDPLTAPLEAFMHSTVLDEPKELDLLQAQIDATHATEAAVDAQNQALKKELESWRAAGSRVVEREGRIVNLVHKLRGEQQPSNAADAPGVVGLLGRTLLHSGTVATNGPRSYLLQLVMIALFGVLLVFGARMRESVLSLPAKQVMSCGAWGCCMKPMLRRAGASRYVVEVSEIQVCLPRKLPGGDLCMTLRMGQSDALRTSSAEQVDPSMYRFCDVFRLEVGRADGPCEFVVLDKDQSPGKEPQKLALLEVTAKELLKAAHQGGAGYFRYDLSSVQDEHRANKPARRDGTIDEDEMPFAAMRIRDVTDSGSLLGRAGVQRSGVQQGGVHIYSREASPGNFGTFSQ